MSENHTYQQSLLRKYIDGTISSNERHELEKMAMDDVMLFETLEGYSKVKGSDHKSVLNNLNDTILPAPLDRRRIIPWRWMSAAAGLVLVAAIGFLIRDDGMERSGALQKSMSHEWSENDEQGYADLYNSNDQRTNDKNANGFPTAETASADYSNIESEEIFEEKGFEETVFEEAALNDEIIEKVSTDREIPKKEMQVVTERQQTRTMQKRANRTFTEDKSSPSALGIENSKSSTNQEKTPEEIRALPTKSIAEIAATSAGQSTSDGDDNVSIRGSRGNTTNYYVDGIRVSESSIPLKDREARDVKAKDNIKKEVPVEPKTRQTESSRKSKADLTEETEGDKKMRTVTGLINDRFGTELIGANVMIDQLNKSVLTDLDGKFEIKVPDEDIDLEISLVGYLSVTIFVQRDQEKVVVQLKESYDPLDEIIIRNARSKKYDNRANPLMGYHALEEYLLDNIISPDDCQMRTVVMQLTINADGDLKDIISDKKDNCFYEARRVILEAGKWKTSPPRREIIIEYKVYMR